MAGWNISHHVGTIEHAGTIKSGEKNMEELNHLIDLQEMAHDFNRIGAISDETVNYIDTRVKLRELREKMLSVHEMNGEEIRGMRDRLGITQSMLAVIMNMSVVSISKWERGEKKPNGAALRMLNTIEYKGFDIFAK
ncbi:helix-turn-helix domain-containing protein [Erwiniaceae bacterium BAC15a-03b]|uniref:Helix-turn-helix domain-containing protein n=1 Tax=Winslowiella arboricola TaxID=2978220 RepID=A0A9J6PKR7_9GAMM|nr:helix-turn-helix domain-containing protein [Winslowiella arboricola]MCU5771310.1 helix-turn-helix domain-containing protein [Winslowiella arboricola]MCU5777059.1 helix-turn-helix domain-containing protein [Winslowiella arboricola]